MSRRTIHDFLVLQAGFIAAKLVMQQPKNDPQLANELIAISPDLPRHMREMSDSEAAIVTELMSIVGKKWCTLECVAHLMARPDMSLDGQLRAVASCLRVGAGDHAEYILRPILAEHPGNAFARELEGRLAKLRQEDLEQAKRR